MDGFFIAYDKGYSSFVQMDSNVPAAYTISDGTIEVSYQKGYFAKKTVTKKIPKIHYGRLIDIFIKYQNYLSDSDTAIKTQHGFEPTYRYVFGDSYGSNCAQLFDAKKSNPEVTEALDEYQAWIEKFIS